MKKEHFRRLEAFFGDIPILGFIFGVLADLERRSPDHDTSYNRTTITRDGTFRN